MKKNSVMNFYNVCEEYSSFDFNDFSDCITKKDIEKSLTAGVLHVDQFLSLLSPAAVPYLENMARIANQTTLQYFGRTIQLYTPMYLSNYCENQCVYCGFNTENGIERKKLSLEEVEKEASFIASTGLKHILILTGESREESPLSYIRSCVKVLKKYFSSISVEIYPLVGREYADLVKEGVDGLTIYQETYNRNVYDKVHLAGPKKDFRFRLETPERALKKDMRMTNVGVLLGLDRWEKEVFLMGLHARYLQDKFADREISVSIPRLRPHTGKFKPACEVTDKNIVQIVTALRLFLPRVGITLSTRERGAFRENLIPLGITRMSAGSTTTVGGHTISDAEGDESTQFEISDERDVSEIKKMLAKKDYQPVMKDWMEI